MFINNDYSASTPSHSTRSFIWFICNYWSKKQYTTFVLSWRVHLYILKSIHRSLPNQKIFFFKCKSIFSKRLIYNPCCMVFWRCKASLYPSISLSSPFFFHPTYNEIRFLLLSFHASVSIFTFSCHRTIDIDASACCFIVY